MWLAMMAIAVAIAMGRIDGNVSMESVLDIPD